MQNPNSNPQYNYNQQSAPQGAPPQGGYQQKQQNPNQGFQQHTANQQYPSQQYDNQQQPYQQQPYQQVPQNQYQDPPMKQQQAQFIPKSVAADDYDRVNFVRKVYSILACQLSLTAGFILLCQTTKATRNMVMSPAGASLGLICCVFSIVFMCSIICCFGRKAPLNYILLFAFTVCETYMVGALTIQYDQKTVMMAGCATAMVTIALTIYAMRTNVPIEFFGALSWVVCLATIPLMIMSYAIGGTVINTVYCVFGAILYGIYLIIDTMMITGGKNNMSNVKLSMDDYIIGALMLYLDIVMLFVYILRILGDR